MKKLFKISALFCFFCLLSCKNDEPYRAIEITVINADQGTITLFRLPEKKLVYQEYFDKEYQQTTYISNIPDGEYYLQVISDMQLIDTSFVYTGRIGLGVEF